MNSLYFHKEYGMENEIQNAFQKSLCFDVLDSGFIPMILKNL